jgi:hypothetical protein
MLRLRILAPIAALAAALPIAVTSAQNGPASGSKPAARAQAPAGVSLFDGKTLQGWRGYKRPDATGSRWRAEDGMLTLDRDDGKDTRGARDIITTETFDLFDLTWEWKVSQGGNSGLKYFVLEDRDSAIGHEYQMIDDERHPDAKIGPHRQTAAFYDVLAAPQPRPLKPAGEWNTSRIRVAPSRVVPGSTRVYHYLNDVRVLEYELDSPELRTAIEKSKFKGIERFGKLQKGHILIQDHGDQVWYRNIKIVRLSGQS